MNCGKVCFHQGCYKKCINDFYTCNGIHYCREHHPDNT